MTNKEGSDESICMSSSVECGKIAESFPKMGETARPGNAFSADIDHMPINVIRGIVPCPVCIRIIVSLKHYLFCIETIPNNECSLF